MKQVGTVRASHDWNWSAVGVTEDIRGFYLVTDAGCSCNSPFDEGRGIVDTGRYDHTGPLTKEQCIEELRSLTAPGSGYYNYSPTEVEELVNVISGN